MLNQISSSGEDTGDFSIAEVTVNVTTTDIGKPTTIVFNTSNIQDNKIATTWSITIDKEFCTKKLYLVLYKGEKTIGFSNNEIDFDLFHPTAIPTTSGKIEVNYPDDVKVTGDGVFNLTGYTLQEHAA